MKQLHDETVTTNKASHGFVIRPLTTAQTATLEALSSAGQPALNSLFRVYLVTHDLVNLGLKPGDFCRLTVIPESDSNKQSDPLITNRSVYTGNHCFAVAFRTAPTDNALARGHIRLSDHLRQIYKFRLSDRVLVESLSETWSETIPIATHVYVKHTSLPGEDISGLVYCALQNFELITTHTTFKVIPKNPTNSEARLTCFIKHISINRDIPTDTPIVATPHSTLKVHATHDDEDESFQSSPLTFPNVGGLDKQISLIQRYLQQFQPFKNRRLKTLLITGAEGTGKSLLIRNIVAWSHWKKVIRLENLCESSRSITKLNTFFSDAIQHQPALLIIENCDLIFTCNSSHSSSLDANSLISKLSTLLDDALSESLTLIATAVSANRINALLRRRFAREVELPIPDENIRRSILNILIQDMCDCETPLAIPNHLIDWVAAHTHGYVGSDLEFLVDEAFQISNDVIPVPQTISTLNYPSQHDFQSALLKVRPSALKALFIETPKITWSDIGGYEDVKQLLYDATSRTTQFPHLLQSFTVTPIKGILLYGPPGCSKTMTAQAAATESGFNFLAVKGPELTSMWLGETERAIREVFSKARAAQPSILFFDEIDAIAGTRKSAKTPSSSTAASTNVVSTLLNEMDGIEPLNGVLVLAATNRPDSLDEALLRPGRFSSLVFVDLPGFEARCQILSKRLAPAPLHCTIDIPTLAKKTHGYSGAEIVNIANVACNLAATAAIKSLGHAYNDKPNTTATNFILTQHFDQAIYENPRSISAESISWYKTWRESRSSPN